MTELKTSGSSLPPLNLRKIHPRHLNFLDCTALNWIHNMCSSLYYKRQVWSRDTCLSSNTFAVKKPSFFIMLKALERTWPGCSAIMSASLSGSYLLANMFFQLSSFQKRTWIVQIKQLWAYCYLTEAQPTSSHRLDTLITFPIWFSLGTPHNPLQLSFIFLKFT